MDIYLDGLERSGNVFLSYCIGRGFHQNLISLRSHELKTLIEYKKRDPFIVPLRDAFDSICSARVMRDYSKQNSISYQHRLSTNELINRYTKYVTFLINSDRFFIAPFKEFTSDPEQVLQVINKKYPNLTRTNIAITLENTLQECKEKNIDAENPYTGHIPRKYSAERKITEKEFLPYINKINNIQELINRLYERYYHFASGQ